MADPRYQMVNLNQNLSDITAWMGQMQACLDDLHAKVDIIGQALGVVQAPMSAEVAAVEEPLAEVVVEEPAAPKKKGK